MRRKKFSWSALVVLTACFTVAAMAVSFADQIVNTLDSSVDAIAEQMPLTAGGANGATRLYVVPQNGDGKQGCNLTGSTTLTVSITSSDTSVATVSPSSVTFTSCVTSTSGPVLTVTPLSAGTSTISLTQTGNTTGGTFDLSTATFQADVTNPTPANTAPQISVGGVTGGASYEFGSVPAATCNVIDAEDGNSSFPATLSAISGPLSAYGLGDQTASCSYTDAGGLTASASVTYSIVDTTSPVVTVPADITTEATGPSGAIVTFSASALDGVFGAITPICVPSSGSTFGIATTTVECTATDGAGNTGSNLFSVTVQDTTPPGVTVPANITAEATGPGGAVVTFSASATDLVDGAITPTCTPASGSTFALDATTTVSCSATDGAGNTGSDSFTVTVQDTTPPTLTLPSDITAQASGNSQAGVTYSASATDLVDGSVPVTCNPPSGSSFPVGTTTVSCSATDAHNNTANGSFTVTVNYTFTGFFQPVDNLPTLNKTKAGSAIPVKFRLGGDQGLNVFAGGFPTSKTTTCGLVADVDTIEVTLTAGGSSLTYDASANQYIYVWKTDKSWTGCRTLTVKFADGSVQQANFQFTK